MALRVHPKCHQRVPLQQFTPHRPSKNRFERFDIVVQNADADGATKGPPQSLLTFNPNPELVPTYSPVLRMRTFVLRTPLVAAM